MERVNNRVKKIINVDEKIITQRISESCEFNVIFCI